MATDQPSTAGRNRDIAARLAAGESRRTIAAAYHVTPERIRQIASRQVVIAATDAAREDRLRDRELVVRRHLDRLTALRVRVDREIRAAGRELRTIEEELDSRRIDRILGLTTG